MLRILGVMVMSCLVYTVSGQVKAAVGKYLVKENSELTKARLDRSARFAQEIVEYPSSSNNCSVNVGVSPLASINAWGFLEGTNEFGDLEKAQQLTFTGSAEYEVIGVLAFFAMPSIVGDGMIKAIIYDEDTTSGEPGDSLGESVSLSVSMLAVPDSFVNATVFQFLQTSSAKPMAENFFVSIDISQLYASADTLTLFSTAFGCGQGSDTWDRISDGTWFAVSDTINSWGLDLDYLINAVVEFDDPTSTDAYIANGGLRLHPAYPNPAQDEVFINYSLEQATAVSIEVYDLAGKRVESRALNKQDVGKHQTSIQTSRLLPGQYYYRVFTDHGQLSSRFIVE